MNKKDKELSPKKKAFIEYYPKFKRISKTAQAVGICQRTVYDWLKRDEVFNTAFSTLKKEIDQQTLEEVEAELEARALGRKPAKMADVLLMFLAKGLAPDKYRERSLIDKAVIGDITVKMAIPPYANSPEQFEEVRAKLLKEGKDAIQVEGSAEESDTRSSEEA